MYDPVRQLAFYGIEYNEFEFRPKSNLGYYWVVLLVLQRSIGESETEALS